MKLIDKLEAVDNSIVELQNKIENSQDIAELKGFTHELNALQAQKQALSEVEAVTENSVKTEDYLSTDKAVNEFLNSLVADRKSGNSGYQSWSKKLAENGLTVEDPAKALPRKLVQELQTSMIDSNDILKLAKLTHNNGEIVMRDLTSDDVARVHQDGETKVIQNSKIKTSLVEPRQIYVRHGFGVLSAKLLENFDDIFQELVSESVQKITNKVVDLMLFEGTANPNGAGSGATENGFISIKNETDTGKVIHVDGKTDLPGAIEMAIDELIQPGKKYLVVTKKQKHAIIKALRTRQPNVNYSSSNDAVAAEFGLDGLILYRGTAKIKPTIITEGSYAIDMGPIDRIEQFRIDNNTEDLLIETMATGRTLRYGGIVVIDIADE
jgi:putative minor structural protein